jgi:bifunctional DNA-binding transcriptional regulator/antitoxin component of YhaV-PrlF toxin-antitoxin module
MTTILSSKGQVVLNAALRRSLGLSAGTVFSVRSENRTIILEPITPARPKGRIVKQPGSGLSVLEAGRSIPMLTSERVREMLADFP